MSLIDRDYMNGRKHRLARPSLLARVRFGLWIAWRGVVRIFRR